MELPHKARCILYSVGLIGGVLTGAYVAHEITDTPGSSGRAHPSAIHGIDQAALEAHDQQDATDFAPLIYAAGTIGGGILGLGIAVDVDMLAEEEGIA